MPNHPKTPMQHKTLRNKRFMQQKMLQPCICNAFSQDAIFRLTYHYEPDKSLFEFSPSIAPGRPSQPAGGNLIKLFLHIKKMAKRGRKSKFDTIDKDQVRMLAEKGFIDQEMADFFDVTLRTWYSWKEKNPDFADQIKEWKAAADQRVERSLFERACGYSHLEEKIFQFEGSPIRVETVKHYPPDTGAAAFWLKNRMPNIWKDRKELDLPEESPILDLIRAVLNEKK